MRCHKFIAGFVLLFCASSSFSAPQQIAAECTTKATGGDGVRDGCDSEVTRITAPENHVFAEKTLAGGETSSNGSEHGCRFNWGDYVEILPNTKIMQPTSITLQAHARSPKGHFSGHGWVQCKYTVEISKYK